jgi:1-acyl-sn-glycerol-3-phosphate acyltransferase
MVPVTINNSWKMTRWGAFPMGLGNKLTLTVHPPLPIKDMPFSEVFEETEKAVTGRIEY